MTFSFKSLFRKTKTAIRRLKSVVLKTGIKSEPGSSGPASPVQGSNSARASPVRSASTVPSTPPPTGASTCGSSSTENSPNIDGERGDLIEFYNKVNSIYPVKIQPS